MLPTHSVPTVHRESLFIAVLLMVVGLVLGQPQLLLTPTTHA